MFFTFTVQDTALQDTALEIKKLPDLSCLAGNILDLSHQNFNHLRDPAYRKPWEAKQDEYNGHLSKLMDHLKLSVVACVGTLVSALLLTWCMSRAMHYVAFLGLAHVIKFALGATAGLLLVSTLFGGLSTEGFVSFFVVALVTEFSSTMALAYITMCAFTAAVTVVAGWEMLQQGFDALTELYAWYAKPQGEPYDVLKQYIASIPEHITEVNLSHNALGSLALDDVLSLLAAMPSTVKSINLSENALLESYEEEEQQTIRHALAGCTKAEIIFDTQPDEPLYFSSV